MQVARTFCLTIMLSTWARYLATKVLQEYNEGGVGYPRAAWMAAPVCDTGGEHAMESHKRKIMKK